ncbi:MAG: helix-turn-helix transcriptional regulator [Acidimicrobiales bacterium]|nr:helix-turn-helix transcriptional regulator [Acidimicrobiales bacterium]MCB1017832.1 helix-turn-helix transcriptional regulator [Acidimicrobiales bacterium]
MRWSEIGEQACPVAKSLSVLGDRWTMLVLREAFWRVRRFEDFQARTGAPRPVLAERLKMLVDQGVLERRQYSERPARFEYRLTEKGVDLYPVVISLLEWGERWMTDPDEPPVVELRHRACGHPTHPRLACSECGEFLDARSVEAVDRRPDVPARSA